MRYLYKYPHAAFPYARLVEREPRAAAAAQPEFELIDTGVFDDRPLLRRLRRVREGRRRGHADADHRRPTAARARRRSICCRRSGSATPGPGTTTVAAPGTAGGCTAPDGVRNGPARRARCYGTRWLYCDRPPELLFTENETNTQRLFGTPAAGRLCQGRHQRLRSCTATRTARQSRRRAAPRPRRTTRLIVPAGGARRAAAAPDGSATVRVRRRPLRRRVRAHLRGPPAPRPTSSTRRSFPPTLSDDARAVMRQALAGMLWSKQFYHYVVRRLARGRSRRSRRRRRSACSGRNHEWDAPLQRRRHLDAGQVGVPVVRRLGPGLPLRAAGAGRSGLRQGAARADAARVVHAPERPAAGLRVGVRRRQSAGARLGGVARLQDRAEAHAVRATACSSSASFTSCC